MKKVLNPNFQAGSTSCNEPRPIGDILAEMISSDSRVSGNLVGISINLCKSIQKELFINDTP